MNYAMSDIHGCLDKYLNMLEVIELGSEDTLYILGDVVDRGPDGIRLLLDISDRSNVVLLRGNHDDTAMKILTCLSESDAVFNEDELVPLIRAWVSDGGSTTLNQFMHVSAEERKKALQCLQCAVLSVGVEVNGQKYFLSHTVPEKEMMPDTESVDHEGYLWGEPDYELQYFEDKVLVTGHTPTELIDKECSGRIYIKNNHIAIDCGAVYDNGRLGCICLDTMKEFYV